MSTFSWFKQMNLVSTFKHVMFLWNLPECLELIILLMVWGSSCGAVSSRLCWELLDRRARQARYTRWASQTLPLASGWHRRRSRWRQHWQPQLPWGCLCDPLSCWLPLSLTVDNNKLSPCESQQIPAQYSARYAVIRNREIFGFIQDSVMLWQRFYTLW